METSTHTTVHALPDASVSRRMVQLGLRPVCCLDIGPADLQRPLPVTFDAALADLERLPRLYIEPDGSFIWIGPQGPLQWKFDGQLHDSVQGLMTVELKVSGTNPALDDLLACFGWPTGAVAFQLVREGVYVGETTFRSLLSGDG